MKKGKNEGRNKRNEERIAYWREKWRYHEIVMKEPWQRKIGGESYMRKSWKQTQMNEGKKKKKRKDWRKE